MRTLKRHMILLLMALITGSISMAQKGVEDGSRYGHGEDSINCIKNLSLYREFVKYDNYDDAIGPWRKVYKECPRATKNVYIDGVKMYKHYFSQSQDPEEKAAFMDTVKQVYMQRIKYYKQRGSVLGRLGVDLLRYQPYREENTDIVEEAYGYLGESIEILKARSSPAIVATYFTSALKLYQEGRIDATAVFQDYELVANIVDEQLARKPDDKDLMTVKTRTDDNFIASGVATCETLVNYFEPQFESKQSEVDFLKRVVRFMTQVECEDQPLYAQASEKLYQLEPSAEAAYGLARLFLGKEEYGKAINYYNEAIERETDPVKKSEYHYQLGYIAHARLNDSQEAREHAREAIRLNPDWGEPYILIGDAYASSKGCFEDEFEKTTVYWAAVDQYLKAKSVDPAAVEKANERISTYKQYFPDVETLFFFSLKDGDRYTVGCWINETTTVRAR